MPYFLIKIKRRLKQNVDEDSWEVLDKVFRCLILFFLSSSFCSIFLFSDINCTPQVFFDRSFFLNSLKISIIYWIQQILMLLFYYWFIFLDGSTNITFLYNQYYQRSASGRVPQFLLSILELLFIGHAIWLYSLCPTG